MWRANIIYRQEAIDDLQRIFDVIAESSGSDLVAQRFIDRIMRRCSNIGDVPYGGWPRDDLKQGLRTVPFEGTALIAYLVSDLVEITNVFYGGRDYETLFQTRDGTL